LENVPTDLDISIPDDRIVAEAISYRNTHGIDEIIILTNDQGLLETSEDHDFTTMEIPDEWFLPPEPDPNEKRNKELEDKLKKLQNTRPKIDIAISDSEGTVLQQSHNIVVKTCREMDCSEIEELLAAAINEWPVLSETEIEKNAKEDRQFAPSYLGFDHDFELPCRREIQKYYENYQAWTDEVRRFLEELQAE